MKDKKNPFVFFFVRAIMNNLFQKTVFTMKVHLKPGLDLDRPKDWGDKMVQLEE